MNLPNFMKKRIFIRLLFLVTLACTVLCGCDDEISIWGDKQDLDGSTWSCDDIATGWDSGSSTADTTKVTAQITLKFQNNTFVLNASENFYAEADTTYTITGTYTYEHPYIHLVSEEETIEAWVNYDNYICYDGGVYFSRYHYLEKQ